MTYWYIFPIAVFIALICNASGFSGSVLFQPFFNLILQVPISQSISTGIATETIGMSSGAYRYFLMGRIDWKAVRKVIPFVFSGVFVGVFIFSYLPATYLKLLVGVCIFLISTYQLSCAFSGRFGTSRTASLDVLGRGKFRIKQIFAGIFSASTGTGIAEIHQPMFEHDAHLLTKRSNATAITVEALGNWIITFLNLTLGTINYEILIFSATGVLVGAQLGALVSDYISDRIAKIAFGFFVSLIGIIYIITSVGKIFYG